MPHHELRLNLAVAGCPSQPGTPPVETRGKHLPQELEHLSYHFTVHVCAGGCCVEWIKMLGSAAPFTGTFYQSISPATSSTTKPAARLEPPLPRGAFSKVVGAVLRNSRCGMVQGPQAPCNALLQRTSLHRRDAALPGPYFAQKGALERPRQGLCSNACFGATTSSCVDYKTLLQSCCLHDCMVGNLLPQGALRTQFGVQGCAGKAATVP